MSTPLTLHIHLADLEPMKKTFEELFIIAHDPDMPERLSKRMLEIVDSVSPRLGKILEEPT